MKIVHNTVSEKQEAFKFSKIIIVHNTLRTGTKQKGFKFIE